MTLLPDLLTLALLAKLLWELGADRSVTQGHWALVALTLPFLLGLAPRANSVLRSGASIVTLILFVASLAISGAGLALIGLLGTMFVLYLFGKITGAAARPLIVAALLVIAGYLLYRYGSV